MSREELELEKILRESIVDNGERYGLLDTFIQNEQIQAIATAVMKWHISEEIKGLEEIVKQAERYEQSPYHSVKVVSVLKIQSKIAELEKLRGGK